MFFLSGLTCVHASTVGVESKSALSGKTSVVGGESVLSMVLSLVLILVIIFLLAWGARRFGGMSFKGNTALKVVTGISMGSRERIVLVQVGEQQLLLGVSPGRVQTLHVLDKPIDTGSKDNQGSGLFSDRLKAVLNKTN